MPGVIVALIILIIVALLIAVSCVKIVPQATACVVERLGGYLATWSVGIHFKAPDIAGKNLANPIATILSAAMMLRYSFDMDKEADAIEAAVQQVLTDGYRTGDIYSEGCKKVGTIEMGDLIAARIH